MIQAIFSFTLMLFLLGGIALYRLNLPVEMPVRRRRWIKFIGYFLIVHLVIGSALAGPSYSTLLVSALGIIGAYELLGACLRKGLSRSSVLNLAVTFGVYLFLVSALVRFSQNSTAEEFVFVYLVTASLDGFSQLTGQWIGRYPLAPNISPNKTVEGALGGFLAAALTAFALRSLPGLSVLQSLFVGLTLAAAGLGGDLAASYVKRRSKIKDFGRIIPQHGGVLDRFDSLLLTAPTFSIWRG